MSSPNPGPEEAGYPCAWKPAVSEIMVVLDPVVEESEDIFSVAVPCQDGEPVGMPFCSFYQSLVFVADSHSCGGSWDANELVFQVTIITK